MKRSVRSAVPRVASSPGTHHGAYTRVERRSTPRATWLRRLGIPGWRSAIHPSAPKAAVMDTATTTTSPRAPPAGLADAEARMVSAVCTFQFLRYRSYRTVTYTVDMPTASSRRRYAPRVPAAERREQVLDAALVLIDRDGYGAVTMEAVAREIGVTKPVVY